MTKHLTMCSIYSQAEYFPHLELLYQSNREEIPTHFSSEQGNPECMYDQNIRNREEIPTLFSYEQENPQSG